MIRKRVGIEAISKYDPFGTPCDVINTSTSGDIDQGEEDSGSRYVNIIPS